LYGIPARWLESGKELAIERAPTMFGPLSLTVRSRLREGQLQFTFQPPPHAPKSTTLRLPLPDGWTIVSAIAAGTRLPVEGNVITLPPEPVQVTVNVANK
jgi:hypothetical protein